MILDYYSLPLIKETLYILINAYQFIKVNVYTAFYKLRIAKGNKALTTFYTQFRLFKQQVCLFSLSSILALFQRYINLALKETLGQTTIAYIDNILIYSYYKLQEAYLNNIRHILTLIQEARLNLDLEKCVFAVKEVKYLSYIIRASKLVRLDLEKLRAI